MKVLIALDVSGSINLQEVARKVEELHAKIPADAVVFIRTFDLVWIDFISIEQLRSGNFVGGAGTSLLPVLQEVNQYDYTYVLTDGYIDDLDKLPHNSEVVLLEE